MSEISLENQNIKNEFIRVDYADKISSILVDKNPLDRLHKVSNSVPSLLDYDISIKLKKELDNPDKKESAMNELVYYCLPTLDRLLQEVKELGVSEEDLISVGFESLIKNIQSWKPSEEGDKQSDNLKFRINSPIKNEIRNFICSEYNIDVGRFELIPVYFKIKDEFQQIHEKLPTLNDWQVLNEMFDDYSQNLTEEQKNNFTSLRYLDVGQYKDKRDLLKFINNQIFTKKINVSPEEEISSEEILRKSLIKDGVETAFLNLPERLKTIIKLREEGYTQEEIAKRLGVTKGRISVLEMNADYKMACNFSRFFKIKS